MSSHAEIGSTAHPPRLFTAADLAAMPSELPSGPVDFELDNGRLIVAGLPTNQRSRTQCHVSAMLNIAAEHGHGKAYGSVGVVLWRNPDRVVGVDAAFIASASLPERESPEGYLETIPELVIEIRSKNDSITYLERKIADYLTAGAKVAWLIDAQQQRVTVYRPEADPQAIDRQHTLTLEDLIPGFEIPVADLFRD